MTNIADLHGKVAVITGASSGVGRAIAEAYAATGAFVVAADLTPDVPYAPITHANGSDGMMTPTVVLINERYPSTDGPPRATFVNCNVTDSTSIRDAVTLAVSTYGRLDIMVNNAGVSTVFRSQSFLAGHSCRLHEIGDDILEKDLAVNVRGVALGIKHAAAQFLRQETHSSGDRGWIINTCSVNGLVGSPDSAAYCASKGAVLMLTKATALDYACDRIHINCKRAMTTMRLNAPCCKSDLQYQAWYPAGFKPQCWSLSWRSSRNRARLRGRKLEVIHRGAEWLDRRRSQVCMSFWVGLELLSVQGKHSLSTEGTLHDEESLQSEP